MVRDLIGELMERARTRGLTADQVLARGDFSPLEEAEVEGVEGELGFALPPLIRRVYREVANGGFGPAYGLLGLSGGMVNEEGLDAAGLYLAYRRPDPRDGLWKWPEGLLPLGHLGCGMYLCADCTRDGAPIVWFEPNPHVAGEAWDDSFFRFAPSFEEWLSGWLDGRDFFDEMMNGGETVEERRWQR